VLVHFAVRWAPASVLRVPAEEPRVHRGLPLGIDDPTGSPSGRTRGRDACTSTPERSHSGSLLCVPGSGREPRRRRTSGAHRGAASSRPQATTWAAAPTGAASIGRGLAARLASLTCRVAVEPPLTPPRRHGAGNCEPRAPCFRTLRGQHSAHLGQPRREEKNGRRETKRARPGLPPFACGLSQVPPPANGFSRTASAREVRGPQPGGRVCPPGSERLPHGCAPTGLL
jgi:hypothetical protein